MKDAQCPNCSNYGRAPNLNEMLQDRDDFAFRQRGQIEGYPVWICNKCNNAGLWMKTSFFGKPKPIIGDGFQGLKDDWESRAGTKF